MFSLIKSLSGHPSNLVIFLVSTVTPGFVEPHPYWISENVRKSTNIKIEVKDVKAGVNSK